MALSWTPPETDEVAAPSGIKNQPWIPPETDSEEKIWTPPVEDDPDDPANIKDPLKLNELKQSGQSLNEDQERILFDWENEKPISQRANEFVAKAIPAAAESVKDIAIGGAEFGYKGVLMPAQDILTGGLYYSPEERAKIWRDQELSTKALASGGAQGLDEAIEAGTRMAIYGSAITDRIQGLPKEQRFRRYMSREMMRKFAQAARDETPDTLARLASESPLIKRMVITIAGMQGADPEAQKAAVEEYEKLVKESGMTKEELDEFQRVVNFGDVSMPTSVPGSNTLTAAVSKPLTAATRKAGEISLKGLNLGSRATGWTAGKTIKGGEWIQQKAKDIGQYAVNDPDTFVKTAANTALAPVMLVTKPTKTIADVISDITRQVDKGGAAGRKGMIQRAGEDIRSSELTQKLFGREGKGGVGRSKVADWAIRQSNAMIQPGVSSGTLNVLMGLPDAETAAQAGQQFGTGFGIGAYAGSRVESRVGGLADPRTTMAQKISNLVTPDPTQLRRDQDADIKRFMATASPDLIAQMQDLGSVEKRKVAVDNKISELEDIQARTINPEDSKFIQDQIDGFKKQKESLAKSTPETQREADRLVQLTTLDILDQAKAVGTAAGLRGLNLVFLDPKNAEPFYRNLYGQNLIDAEKNKQILNNKPFLTPDEENTLRLADETLSAFYQDVQNAENSRGFAIRESVTDPESPDFVAPHLRYSNQQGATAVINMDLMKHLSSQGFNLRHTMQHEVQHALENFKEVQDLMSPLRQYLFDQKVKSPDGGVEVISNGVFDDEKLDAYAMMYADKFSPQDGGASFFAQFGGDIDKQRNYIKREILSEIAAVAGEYQGGSRAVLDDVGRKAIDWLEVKTRDGYLKKLKEGLRSVGIVFDKYGGYSELLDAKLTPEVLSAVREYQRGVRDINGALTYNSEIEAEEPDIPITKILGNRALQEKYKEVAPFELEPVVKITQPDGTTSEIKIPEGANIDSLVGVYRIQNGKFVDEEGNEMTLAPEINISAMPDGTQFEVNTRIARKPDGSPITISNREMKRRAIDRTRMILGAIDSAPKDDSGFRMIDVGNGDYRGAMSQSQVEALRKIPNLILSPNLKRKIEFLNDILRRGDGSRVMMEYQAALLNGRYQALSPKLRDEVPIGFRVTKDGNFTLTTISVSRMHDKLNAWVANKPMRLQAWGGDTGKFWDSVTQYLANHAEGKHGEEGLDPDPYIALRKKNIINDLFNAYNADTKAANPERTTLPRQKGKDPVDVIIRSRRLDRINDYSEMSAQKLPINYGKLLTNYMPENNPLARPQSPEEMMANLDGSVTATRIRQAIASGNVEQLESELRMNDDLLPFESLYVSRGASGEPQIQVVSMFEPGVEPGVERSEITTDIDAETEAEMARLNAELDIAEMGQTGQQAQMDQQIGQKDQQAQMGQQPISDIQEQADFMQAPRQINQYMPYIPYSMPKDPRQIMADFYLLTTVGDKAGYFGKDWEKIKGGQMPTRTGLRYEEYGQNLEDAVQKLTQDMKKHMLNSLLFSISAELRHYKANRQPEELLDNPFMKAYSEIYDAYDAVADKNLPEYAKKYLKPMYPETQRARITKGSSKGYQLSNAAVRKALEETGTTIEDFSGIVEQLFREGRWNSSYGGNPWGNIAAGLRMVDQANDTESLVKAIDNAYDLQHNTATVFNKIKKYQREGGYQWLQDMLDFKYHAGSPRELASLASSAAQRITAPALIDIGDVAMDKRRENAVDAIGEDVISEIEKVINSYKPNAENIYRDINVKAPKYSGKDINQELQNWLVKTTDSEKLKNLGVNQDVIQYARLLLAQKMAPKRNVPKDIKEMVSKAVAESKAKNETEVEYGPPIGIPNKPIAKQKELDFQPFTESDFEAYMGAENFPKKTKETNSSNPLVADFKVKINGKEEDTILIADGNGIQLIYDGNFAGIGKSYQDQKTAIREINKLLKTSEIYDLLSKSNDYDDIFEPVTETEKNLSNIPAPAKAGGNIIPADINALNKEIHKLMHLHTESDIGTMVPYKGLVFSGMGNIPADTFTIKTYKDGTLIDEATFNMKSPVYDKSVNAYLEANVKEEGTKSENFSGLALPSQDIKWTPVYSPKGEYENFENGDKPIATQMTAYFDGKPLSAAFILTGNGLYIKTEKGNEYGVQFGEPSSEAAKSYFIDQMLGKYTDISDDMKEYEDVDFSFTPPKPASLAQTKAPSSEPSLSPDLMPIAMTIEELKKLIVNPQTGEISTQPLKKLIQTELKYFPPNKIEGLTYWGNKYAEWAKKAPAEELWPSVTGKPYEDTASKEEQPLKSEDQAIADYKDYKKFKYDKWYANQSKKLKEKLSDEVVKTILDSAWVQEEKGSSLETPEKVLQQVKNKLGNPLLSTDDIKLLNESIESAIGEAAKAMFSANPTSLGKIPQFLNSSQVLAFAESAQEGYSWDDTEGGESISDNLDEFNLSELSDENLRELKGWYNTVLDYENEKKEFYGENNKETSLEISGFPEFKPDKNPKNKTLSFSNGIKPQIAEIELSVNGKPTSFETYFYGSKGTDYVSFNVENKKTGDYGQIDFRADSYEDALSKLKDLWKGQEMWEKLRKDLGVKKIEPIDPNQI